MSSSPARGPRKVARRQLGDQPELPLSAPREPDHGAQDAERWRRIARAYERGVEAVRVRRDEIRRLARWTRRRG